MRGAPFTDASLSGIMRQCPYEMNSEGFELAANGYSEFAGATFSLDGSTLFVNAQSPGITFAITGPWRQLSSRLTPK